MQYDLRIVGQPISFKRNGKDRVAANVVDAGVVKIVEGPTALLTEFKPYEGEPMSGEYDLMGVYAGMGAKVISGK